MWIALLSALIAAPSLTAAVDAEFEGKCDNKAELQRSNDNGETVDWVKTMTEKKTLTKTLKDVGPSTVLRIKCKDDGGVCDCTGHVKVNKEKYVMTNKKWESTLKFYFEFDKVLKTGDAVIGNGDAAADAVLGSSLYYLMMLTCCLLLINIALITNSICRSCTSGAPKYSKVDLYSDGEVVVMNKNIEA